MIRLAFIVPLLSALLAQDAPEKPEAFTFLFWTDQELDPGNRVVPGEELPVVPQHDEVWLYRSDLAKRSPSYLQRLDQEAAQLKIAAYRDIWAAATPLV